MTGDELKALRESTGLTQKGFAAALGCTPAYICLMERGKQKVTDNVLALIAKAFPEPEAKPEEAEPEVPAEQEEPEAPEEQKPEAEPEPRQGYNPLTIAFAVKVLVDCGWMKKHDREITTAALSQRGPITEGWHDANTPPPEAGVYRTQGYTRSGMYYKGKSIYYEDGHWYTLNGKRMNTPDYWKECSATLTKHYD
jgi:transcriptional regulator with XRE-family HTH domain